MPLHTRLSALYFLQFGIWGCYLTCLGQLLGGMGLGSHIAWFYAAVGFVSLFMPAAVGHVADRWVNPVRLLGICHLGGAGVMAALWLYAVSHTTLSFAPFFGLYLLFLCCFMPTLALANTVCFGILKSRGLQPVDHLGRIRLWGTVGFVAAMWLVNGAWYHQGHLGYTLNELSPEAPYRFQYGSGQLLCAALIALLTALYTLTLPKLKRQASEGSQGGATLRSLRDSGLLRQRYVRVFLLLAILGGVCLQITNGFATPFISHFRALPQYASSAASGNATMLFSLSQIAEACCVLLVGVSLRRFGIRAVIITAFVAWALRFGLFAFGNPGARLWMLILSMIVYGVAFNFFTIAGHLYMDRITPATHRGLGQGLFMLMSNGVGASLGTLVAGRVVNAYCHWQPVMTPTGPQPLFTGNWTAPWALFALYALLVALLYALLFRPQRA